MYTCMYADKSYLTDVDPKLTPHNSKARKIYRVGPIYRVAPNKVSHDQIINIVLHRIKVCQ